MQNDRQFGRIPSPIDIRDWKLGDFITEEPPHKVPGVIKWDFPSTALDQKDTPHCVGFSIAHFGINLPTFTAYTERDAHDLYYKCKVVDGDPNGENGTTIRSAAKVLQDIGAIDNYAFARSIDNIIWWLVNRGPIIVGTIWTDGMMRPDENGLLDIGGFILGGHAYILNEITPDDKIGIKNSWGPNWGDNGKAYITIEDFKKLFEYGGEALAAVELENYKIKKESWIASLIKSIVAIFCNPKKLSAVVKYI